MDKTDRNKQPNQLGNKEENTAVLSSLPKDISAGGSAPVSVGTNGPVSIGVDVSTGAVTVGVQEGGIPSPAPAPRPAIYSPAPAPAPVVAPARPAAPVPAAKPASVASMPAGNAARKTIPQAVSSAPAAPQKVTAIDVKPPVRGKVVDRKGKRVGAIRGGELFDRKGTYRGVFRKEKTNVFLYRNERRAAYIDKNDNILTPSGQYVGTIRRFRWLPVLLALLFLALATVTSATLAAYYISFSGRYAPVLFMTDESGENWQDTENLDVFFNERFGDSVIAPGMDGSYYFTLENQSPDTVEFALAFREDNAYGIGLVYRLWRDGSLLGGVGWLSAADLGVEDMTVEGESSTVFRLEWYWRDNDALDTAAGENGAQYTLHIDFSGSVARHQSETAA